MVRYEVFVTSKTASFENEYQTKKNSFLLFSFAIYNLAVHERLKKKDEKIQRFCLRLRVVEHVCYMQVHGYIIGDHSFLDMVMTSYKIFAQFLSVFFWLSGVDPHSRLQVRESFTGLTGLRWPDSLLELNIFTRAWFACTVLYIPQPHGQLNW